MTEWERAPYQEHVGRNSEASVVHKPIMSQQWSSKTLMQPQIAVQRERRGWVTLPEAGKSRGQVGFRLNLSRTWAPFLCSAPCSALLCVCCLHPQDVSPLGHELAACCHLEAYGSYTVEKRWFLQRVCEC